MKVFAGAMLCLTIVALALLSYLGRQKRTETTQAFEEQQKSLASQRSSAINDAQDQIRNMRKVLPPVAAAAPPRLNPDQIKASQVYADKAESAVSKASNLGSAAIQQPSAVQSSAAASAVTYEVYMPGIVSLVMGVFAIYLLLNKKTDPDTRKWAFGILGTIVGYWLKGSS